MIGFLIEMAGATISGALLIFLIGLWRGSNYDGLDGASGKALSGALMGWAVISLVSAWGYWPNQFAAIIAPFQLIPAALIAWWLLLRRARKQELAAMGDDA